MNGMTPRQMVRTINDHCDKGNGIYTNKAGRCFRAYLMKDSRFSHLGQEVYVTPDFGATWVRVDDSFTFWDYNGRPVGNLPHQP